MSVSLEIVDLDELFHTAAFPPVIVNQFDVFSEADKERLNRLIYTRYEGDSLESIPSCECGKTSGGAKVGSICQHCGTEVMAITERPLEPILWLCPPKGVTTFINPQVWAILEKSMTHSGVSCLEYLVNPGYEANSTTSKTVRKFLGLEIPRGINHFFDHFDEIMQLLFEEGIIKDEAGQRGGKKRDIARFLELYRDRIFCTHIPIPSRLTFITEKTLTTTFAVKAMEPAIDAIRTISDTENPASPLSLRNLQARAMKANKLMVEYHQGVAANLLEGKPGWFRKHVFGTRSPFTFRAVINSLSENHDYEELHLPWALAATTFKVHLTSKLLKRGFSPNQANAFLQEHTLKYHPLLDELFQELIADAPGRGPVVLFNRNEVVKQNCIVRS